MDNEKCKHSKLDNGKLNNQKVNEGDKPHTIKETIARNRKTIKKTVKYYQAIEIENNKIELY